jgi:hypothetical protein
LASPLALTLPADPAPPASIMAGTTELVPGDVPGNLNSPNTDSSFSKESSEKDDIPENNQKTEITDNHVAEVAEPSVPDGNAPQLPTWKFVLILMSLCLSVFCMALV